jgi:hypothetical protein
MPWKGGFMRHHQQGEEFSHSPHRDMLDCMSCHNPHKSVVYELGGTIAQCRDCHEGDAANGFYVVEGMETLDCNDCHMPAMGKSAVAFNEYTGDIHGHLFSIMTEPIAAADNVDEDNGSFFWKQDAEGRSSATLDYACLGCHLEFSDLNLTQAAEYAANIHTEHRACVADLDQDGVVGFNDLTLLLGNWGGPGGDVNQDGTTGFADLSLLLGLWGACP